MPSRTSAVPGQRRPRLPAPILFKTITATIVTVYLTYLIYDRQH